MSGPHRAPFLVRLSAIMAVLGALLSLALFLHAGPYTLVIFMFGTGPGGRLTLGSQLTSLRSRA